MYFLNCQKLHKLYHDWTHRKPRFVAFLRSIVTPYYLFVLVGIFFSDRFVLD